MPAKGESVIGIVTVKSGDVFKVDIGRSEQTSLSPLAFEGATKRNRPEYLVVVVIYIVFCADGRKPSDIIICCDMSHESDKWRGVFKMFLFVNCRLLSPQSKIVKDLEKIFPFEMVIGVNGRIWVKT
ncbi:EXOS3 protein, partial [Polyodon spathula]|nr:EXOS3 protein [Polyodon spathula]